MRRQLYVMVKEPRPGRVKTRLGRDIGHIRAAWWFRRQTATLLRRVQDPRWQTVLAVSPDAEGLTSRVWPARTPRVAQGPGNLGDRMARILRTAPPGPVAIIGADIPGITREHVADAFRLLSDHDAVIGPAPDGGYWLIGLRRGRAVPAGLFADVRWSSEHAREDTRRSLGDLSYTEAAWLRDVDTIDDLQRACDA